MVGIVSAGTADYRRQPYKRRMVAVYPTSDVKYSYMFMVGDTAQKTKEANDFTAITFWGVTRQNELYLLDMVHGKWEAPDLEVQSVAFWKSGKRH